MLPLVQKLHLEHDALQSVYTAAEQEANSELQRQGSAVLHLADIYEKTLEVLDKKVRKMVEKWDAGDDLPDILRGARRGI